MNEARNFEAVAAELSAVQGSIGSENAFDVLIVDDGSTDDMSLLASRFRWNVLRHSHTLGYGASLASAFSYSRARGYRHMMTMDADGQHLPSALPSFLLARQGADIVSGSRYLSTSLRLNAPPAPHVNQFLTSVLNAIFQLGITDVGCGMKCINVDRTKLWTFIEAGYLFPIEFWCKCAAAKSVIREVPAPMIYIDPTRSHEEKFGSIASLIDRALFTVLRSMCQLQGDYHSTYGSTCDIPPDRSCSMVLCNRILKAIAANKHYDVPTNEAIQNLIRLQSRLALVN